MFAIQRAAHFCAEQMNISSVRGGFVRFGSLTKEAVSWLGFIKYLIGYAIDDVFTDSLKSKIDSDF